MHYQNSPFLPKLLLHGINKRQCRKHVRNTDVLHCILVRTVPQNSPLCETLNKKYCTKMHNMYNIAHPFAPKTHPFSSNINTSQSKILLVTVVYTLK